MKSKTEKKRSSLSPVHQARDAAFAVLKRCGQKAPVQALLDARLRAKPLAASDAGLLSELVYGYLRKEMALGFVLKSLLRAPEKLPADLLLLLGLAAYELSFLDRIPARATVHTYVGMIRSYFGEGLAKVGNGVLRALARKLEEVQTPKALLLRLCDEQALTGLERLAVLYSLPQWILTLWTQAYGPAHAQELAAAAACTPSPCVRVNMARPDWQAYRQKLCAMPLGEASSGNKPPPSYTSLSHAGTLLNTAIAQPPGAQEVKERAEAFGLAGIRFPHGGLAPEVQEAVRDGRLSLQGAGSQMLLEALFFSPGQNDPAAAKRSLLHSPLQGEIWDACAGRGGKCLALLEAGFMILAASDVNISRLRGLREDALRLGLPLPTLFCASACEPPLRSEKTAQVILLDAPCSGLGTLARHPDLRRLRRADDLPALTALQKSMLLVCWELVPPGGQLVYMTCTVNPAENEGQIQNFLAAHPQARLEQEWSNRPDRAGTDLMYGARLFKN